MHGARFLAAAHETLAAEELDHAARFLNPLALVAPIASVSCVVRRVRRNQGRHPVFGSPLRGENVPRSSGSATETVDSPLAGPRG